MNAPDQLALFEPEGAEALSLLQRWLKEAQRQADAAEKLEVLGLSTAANLCHSMAAEAVAKALVFAILLDLEREAGL